MSKIKNIRVNNIKSIVSNELILDGCSAIVTAGNNKGKTTLLTSLMERIQSKKPPIVVREGASRGVSEMELTTGEKFRWEISSDGKEKLIFYTKDGLKTPLVREISKRYFSEKFDIDKFLNETPKKQSLILQKLLGVDLTTLDEKYRVAYDERKYYKKLLETQKARLDAYDDNMRSEKIDVAKMHSDLLRGSSINQEISQLNKMIFEKKNQLNQLKKEIEDYETKLSSMNQVDLTCLKKDINEAEIENEKIEKNNQAREKVVEFKETESKTMQLEQDVRDIDLKRKKVLSGCKMPKGIEISEDGILVDGFPLDRKQLSLSKIYITSLKLASMNIAEVKMLYFDASPLDRKSLLEIESWANANDLQILIERPDFDGGEISYEIIKK